MQYAWEPTMLSEFDPKYGHNGGSLLGASGLLALMTTQMQNEQDSLHGPLPFLSTLAQASLLDPSEPVGPNSANGILQHKPCSLGLNSEYDNLFTHMSASSTCNSSGPQALSRSPSLLTSSVADTCTAAQSPSSTCMPGPRLGLVTDRSSWSPAPADERSLKIGSVSSDGDAVSHYASSPPSPSCPNTINVGPLTDVTQVASLINLSLSQPGATSFVMVARMGHASTPGSQASLSTALRVAHLARQIHHASHPTTDLAVHAVLSAGSPTAAAAQARLAGGEPAALLAFPHEASLDLHVYHVKHVVQLPPGALPTYRVEPSHNPYTLALQLMQAMLGERPGQPASQLDLQPIEVVFGTAATRVAMSAVSQAQSQLASLKHEIILLPNQADAMGHGSMLSFLLIPTAWLPEVGHASNQQTQAALEAQAMQHLLNAAAGLPNNMASQLRHGVTSYSGTQAISQATNMLQPHYGHLSANAMNNLPANSISTNGHNSLLSYQRMMNAQPPAQKMRAASLSGPMPFMDMRMKQDMHLAGIMEAAGAGAAAAAAVAIQQQQMVAAAAASAAAAATASVQPLQQQGAGGGGQSRGRARKADWVIVTEDTAIKNAAGAVAKVLNRMAPMGMCCPVFMERKTCRYTSVVSVAVKAIAVARGYVNNEGSGHEVGFQPYIRGDSSACAYGVTRPPGAPVTSSTDANSLSRSQSLSNRLFSMASGDLSASDLSRLPGGSPLQGLSPRCSNTSMLFASSPPMLGGPGVAMPDGQLGELTGGSGGSSTCGDEPMPWSDLEQTELAFDVYKVLLQSPDNSEAAGNLPVKVTAHSRPGVVANIISKLIVERSSAVLITAGGRAMHVAMLAVVVARQRLQMQGVDLLLMPKFVTVDTTSTLGWESVFLRFNIVKWSPAAMLAAELSTKLAGTSI